jgi:hypothetical protein
VFASDLPLAERTFHVSQGRPPSGYHCTSKRMDGSRWSKRDYMRDYMREWRKAKKVEEESRP